MILATRGVWASDGKDVSITLFDGEISIVNSGDDFPPNIRLDEDAFRFRLQKTSSRCLQDVLIKTIILALVIRLQKTSSRRLQDEYIRLSHTSSKNVFKMSSRRLGQDQYICLGYMSSRRLQDVFKTLSRHLEDVFKTSLRPLAKISSRCFQDVSIS